MQAKLRMGRKASERGPLYKLFFPSGSQIAAIIRAITSVVGASGMKIEKEGKRENENERPNPGCHDRPLLSIFCEVARQERERESRKFSHVLRSNPQNST